MKKIYVDCLSNNYRAALVEDGVLTELIYQDKKDSLSVGDIYVGRVEKVLPTGISFVNIGRDKPVFLQRNDIKSGREVLIQIEKEALNEKCAVASDKISINGKYAVVIHNDNGVGVSKKITDSAKRDELKILGEKYAEGFGLILRTNCESADIADVERDIIALKDELLTIVEKSQYIKAPNIIRKEADIITTTIRDLITSDCDSVIINDNIDTPYNYEFYDSSVPMFNNFGIESQIEKLFHRKIWLKSGGYIVIDETEAMTVIDVNSGKAVGEKGFDKINEEAAQEAVRQIRLRNLSGMIIIDFISVREGNQKLYDTLEKYLSQDRVKTHIVGMTELGLMQLTRHKKRKPLSKYITHICPCCNGTGYVKSVSYISEKIINEIADIFASTIYNHIEVQSSESVIKELAKNKNKTEERFGKKITLKPIATGRFDYYEIIKYKM